MSGAPLPFAWPGAPHCGGAGSQGGQEGTQHRWLEVGWRGRQGGAGDARVHALPHAHPHAHPPPAPGPAPPSLPSPLPVRWDTFCAHLSGEWVGHYAAYTPWEGKPEPVWMDNKGR